MHLIFFLVLHRRVSINKDFKKNAYGCEAQNDSQQTKRLLNNKKTENIMIIMPVKEGENIERALKKFKRKYERTGVLKELRARQYFTKPSIAKRDKMAHAIYVEQLHRREEE